MKVLNRILYWFIVGTIFVIMFHLLAQSLFSNVKIDQKEILYFVSSDRMVMLMGLAFFLVLVYLWHIHVNVSDRSVRKFIIAISCVNFLFVLCSQNIPVADQSKILKCATEIWQGNYQAFEAGNYLDIYPHQNGIVLFLYFIVQLCGGYNFLLFQMINMAVTGCVYWAVYQYWKRYLLNVRCDEVILAIAFFFPITLYMNFVYGIVLGGALAILSILQQQIYLKNGNIRNLFVSILFISLAYCIKSNYAIFAIGILLIYLVDLFINKRIKSVMGAVGIILGLILAAGIVDTTLNFITNGKSEGIKGTPKEAFVVMGIWDPENAEGYKLNYGWHNGYDDSIYRRNNNDYEETKAACVEDLKEQIKIKEQDPQRAVRFFQKKLISTWCEPSFETFFFNSLHYPTNLQGHSYIYNDVIVYTGRTHRILEIYLDIFQSVIYLGAILYIFCQTERYNISKLIGLIIFLGGFIFHFFWETKSAYAFIYFVLLIPYAVTGLGRWFDRIHYGIVEYVENKDRGKILRAGLGVFVGALLVIVMGELLIVDEDNEKWETFISEHRFIDEGNYYLKSKESDWVYGSEEDIKLYLSLDMNDTWQYQFDDISRESRLTVVDGEIHMVSKEKTDFPSDAYWRWRIERLSGGYCIRWWNDMNKVMTFNEESQSLCLTDYEEGNRNQIWDLKRRN